jgi:hypothetical protein
MQRKAITAARAPTAAVASSPQIRARSAPRRTSSRLTGHTSKNSSLIRTRSHPHSKAPSAKKRGGRIPDNVARAKEMTHDFEEETSIPSFSAERVKREEPVYAPARPAYMSAEREQHVLEMAERMQQRDLSSEVPVASFAYEILKAHPSVRSMGLRERMDFLLLRWAKLNKSKKMDYVNNPLRGLL